MHGLSVHFLGAIGADALSGKRREYVVVKTTRGYRIGFPKTKGLGPGPHRGDDPAILIIVDTNNAGDRVKISGGKQLLGMSGQEDTIHYTRDDLEGLKRHWLLTSGPFTILMLGYSLPVCVIPELSQPLYETLHLVYHILVSRFLPGHCVMKDEMKSLSRGAEDSLGPSTFPPCSPQV